MRRIMVGARLEQTLLEKVREWAPEKMSTSKAVENLISQGLLLESLRKRAGVQEWKKDEIAAAFLAFADAARRKPELLQRWVAAVAQDK